MPSKGVKAKRRFLAEPESSVYFLPVLVAKTNATATEHKSAEAPRRVGIAYGEREKTAPRTARRQGKRNFNALLGLPTNYLQAELRNGTHSNKTGRSYNSTVLPALDRPRLSNHTGSMPTYSEVLQRAHSKNSQSNTSLMATGGAPRSISGTGATISGVNSSLTTPVQLHHHQHQQQQIQIPQPQSQHQVDIHGGNDRNFDTNKIEGGGSLADPHLLGSTSNYNGDVDMGSEEELLSNRVAIEVERRRRQEHNFLVGQKISQSQVLSTLPASLSPRTAALSAIRAEESPADASRSPAEPCSDDIAAEGRHAHHFETGPLNGESLERNNELLGEEIRWRTAATDLDSLGSRDGLTSGSPGGLLGRGVDFPVVPWSPAPSRTSSDDFTASAMSASATASAAASAASTAPGSFDSTAAAFGDGADDIGALGMSRLGTASSYGDRIGSSRGTFSRSSSSSIQSSGMLSSRNSPGFLVDGYAWELPGAGTAHVLVGEDATDIGSNTVSDNWALPKHVWGNSMGNDGEGDSMLPLLMLGRGGGKDSGIGESGGSGYGSTPSDHERQVQWSAGPHSEARLNAMQSLDLNSASLQENPFEAYNNAEEVVVSDAVGDLSAENMGFNSAPGSMLNESALGSDLPSMSEEVEFKLQEPNHDGDGSYGTVSSRSSINDNDNSYDLDPLNDGASYYTSSAFTELDLATRCEVARSAAQRASTAARKEAQAGAQEAAKARAADAAAARARAAWAEARAVALRAQVQRLRLAAAAVAAVDRNSSEVARARAAAAAAAAAEVQEAEMIRKTAAAERKTAAAEKLALVRAKQGGRPSAIKVKFNKPKQEPVLNSEQSQQHELNAEVAVSKGTNSDPWLTKQPLFPDAAPSKKVGSGKNSAKQLQSLIAATAAATALNGVVKEKRVEEDTKAREAGEWRRTALWRPRLAQQQHADGMAAASVTQVQELKAAKLQMRAAHQAAEQKAAAAAAELANARAAVEAAEAEAQYAEQTLQVLAAADAFAAKAKKRAARRAQRQEAKQRLAEESALTAADQDALAASRWAAAQRLEEQAAFESACAAETAHARAQEVWSHENLVVLSDEIDFAERYTLRKEVEWQKTVAEAATVDARLSEEEEAAKDALEASTKAEEAARQAHVLAAQKSEEEADTAAKAQWVAQESAAAVMKSTNEASEAVLAAHAAQALATVLATSDSIEFNHTAAQRVESTKTNQDTMRAQASVDKDAARTQQLDAEKAAEKEVEARAALAQAEDLRAEQAAKLAKVRTLQRARAVAALAATQAADDAASAAVTAAATTASRAELKSDKISRDADLQKTTFESETVVVTGGANEDKLHQEVDEDVENLEVQNVDHVRLNTEQTRADRKVLVEHEERLSATEHEMEYGMVHGRTIENGSRVEGCLKLNSDQARADVEHSVSKNELLTAEAKDDDTANRVGTCPNYAESDANLESTAQMPIDPAISHKFGREESRSGDSGSYLSDGVIKGGAEDAETVLSVTYAPSASMNGKYDVEASLGGTTTISSDQTNAAPFDVAGNDAVGMLVENTSEEPFVKVDEHAKNTLEEPGVNVEEHTESNDQQVHVGEEQKPVDIETSCDGVTNEDSNDDATLEVPGFVSTGAQYSTEVAATAPVNSVAKSTSDFLGNGSSAGSSVEMHEDNEIVRNENVATVAGRTDSVESKAEEGSEEEEAESSWLQPSDGEQQKAMGIKGADVPAADAASGDNEDGAETHSVQTDVASLDHDGTTVDIYTSGEPRDTTEQHSALNIEQPRNLEEHGAIGMELSNEAASNGDVNDGDSIDDSHLAELEPEGFTEVSAMMYINSVVARTASDPGSNGSGTDDEVHGNFDKDYDTDVTNTAIGGNQEPVEPVDSSPTEGIDASLLESIAPERLAYENKLESTEALNDTHDTGAAAMAPEPADVSPTKDPQQPVPNSPESYPSTGLYYERYMFLPAPTPDHVEVTDGADFEHGDGDSSLDHGSSSGGKKSNKEKSKNVNKNDAKECNSNTHEESSSFASCSDIQEVNISTSTRTEHNAVKAFSSRNAQEANFDNSGDTSTRKGSDNLNPNFISEAGPHRRVNSSATAEADEMKLEIDKVSEQAVHATARTEEALSGSEASHIVHGVNGNSIELPSQLLVATTEHEVRSADFVGDERDWAAFQAEVQRQLMVAHIEERRRTRGDRAAARARAAQLKVKIRTLEVDK